MKLIEAIDINLISNKKLGKRLIDWLNWFEYNKRKTKNKKKWGEGIIFISMGLGKNYWGCNNHGQEMVMSKVIND